MNAPSTGGQTFAQAWAAVEVLLPRETFCLEVEAWRHQYARRAKINWKLYVDGEGSLSSPSVDGLLDEVKKLIAARPNRPAHASMVGDVLDIGAPPQAVQPEPEIPFR